jgi:hypothetical protein
MGLKTKFKPCVQVVEALEKNRRHLNRQVKVFLMHRDAGAIELIFSSSSNIKYNSVRLNTKPINFHKCFSLLLSLFII